MAVTEVQLLKLRARSLKSTLENASEKQKQGQVNIQLAQDFNKLIEDVTAAFPQIVSALPQPIDCAGPFMQMGVTSLTYLDLEVYADRLLAALELVAPDA